MDVQFLLLRPPGSEQPPRAPLLLLPPWGRGWWAGKWANSTRGNLDIKEVGDLAKPGTTASGQDSQNVSCLAPELDGGHRRIQDPEGSNFTIKLVSNHLHLILRFTEIFNQETSQHSGRKFWWEHFIKPVDKNEFKDQQSRALNRQRCQLKGVFPDTWQCGFSPLN